MASRPNSTEGSKPLLAVTMGDPCGIGAEVIAKALQKRGVYDSARPFIVGTVREMQAAVSLVGSGDRVKLIKTVAEAVAQPGVIEVLEVGSHSATKFPVGRLSVEAGRASHAWVEQAARLCIDKQVDAMVTAPVNKQAWELAETGDIGHQEVFKRLTGSEYVATMLVSGTLRCMHLSTHKPLREACEYVTRKNVVRAIKLTDLHFRAWGFKAPRIAVAALNPHASDNGLIGREELDEIQPAVEEARAAGIGAAGPVPADSVFNQAVAGKYDVVVVMYHDQGHIAIKVHGFEESVSVNLGIPFLRTSVDHGTAFDIAGMGKADATGMVEALKLATQLASRSALA